MIVHIRRVVVEIYENSLICYESTSYRRVREAIVHHSVVIDLQELVDVQLILFDFLDRPLLSCKGTKFKHTIIEIYQRIHLARGVLLDLLQLDVVADLSTDLFFEHVLVRLQIKHVHMILHFAFLGNGDGSL